MSANTPIRDWPKQRVWLVGASSGIGLALAEALHAAGARVIVSARRKALLDQFVASRPGSAAYAVDVTDADMVKRVSREVVAEHAPSLIVYCAGDYHPMSLATLDAARCEQHLQVNYLGAVRLVEAVKPHLTSGHQSHLSLIGSVAAYRGLPNALAYGPSKAALHHLTEILYQELHPQGVGLSLISPGFVETALTDKNDFAMPALIQPVDAAREIIAGWQRGHFEIHFPKRFTCALKFARLLPYGAYFAFIRKFVMRPASALSERPTP